MKKSESGFMDSKKLLEEMKNAEPVMVIKGQRGGKGAYQLQKVKEVLEKGGKVLVMKAGAVELKDELLMGEDCHDEMYKEIAKWVDKEIMKKVEAGEMHINLQNAAEEIHKNAVAHGWWEGERDTSEVKALIHSEWSEALEEARAGRPMEWYMCKIQLPDNSVCTGEMKCSWQEHVGFDQCPARIRKPEGIAVELIDGVIRILDFMAYKFADKQEEWDDFSAYLKNAREDVRFEYGVDVRKIKEFKLIEILHDYTSLAKEGTYSLYFGTVVGAVFEWLEEHKVNYEAVMLRKHEYNTTRPYKHGKKF